MKKFVPDLICESVFAVDLDKLKERQISGLLVDIDNTLVPWGEPQMEEAFVDWVKRALQEGFQICLVSNAKHDRPKLCRPSGYSGSRHGFKAAGPRPQGMALLGLAPNQVAVIGDQLFTDVFGGNRLGLYTILINPLSTNELDTTKLMRSIERSLWEKMVKRGMISRKHAQIRQGRESDD